MRDDVMFTSLPFKYLNGSQGATMADESPAVIPVVGMADRRIRVYDRRSGSIDIALIVGFVSATVGSFCLPTWLLPIQTTVWTYLVALIPLLPCGLVTGWLLRR